MTRVAITTTPDTAPELANALSASGLEPVELACIRIEPSPAEVLDRLRHEAALAEFLVLTSRRAVSVLWPDGELPDVPVATVGASTAEAVRRAGGSVVLSGTGGVTRLLPSLLPALSGRRVVFPHARASDPATATSIAEVAGALVAEPVYDTIPIGPDPNPTVEAALFGSPSAVTGWCLTRRLDDLVTGAMGATTAQALTGAGHPPAVIPGTPGFVGLAEALARHLRHERSTT